MIKTQGLTHIHLLVEDLDRSTRFYQQVFGMQELFREGPDMLFLRTPGSEDMITLHRRGAELLQPAQRAGPPELPEHPG